MAKNLIPEIAKMLGVELGEEFEIKDKNDGLVSNETYEFSENALLYKNQRTDAYCLVSSTTLHSLLNGDYKIVKRPWKPKFEDSYYTFISIRGKWSVCVGWWENEPHCYALLEKGWIYRTREEAEAALPAVAAEMGVDYEL